MDTQIADIFGSIRESHDRKNLEKVQQDEDSPYLKIKFDRVSYSHHIPHDGDERGQIRKELYISNVASENQKILPQREVREWAHDATGVDRELFFEAKSMDFKPRRQVKFFGSKITPGITSPEKSKAVKIGKSFKNSTSRLVVKGGKIVKEEAKVSHIGENTETFSKQCKSSIKHGGLTNSNPFSTERHYKKDQLGDSDGLFFVAEDEKIIEQARFLDEMTSPTTQVREQTPDKSSQETSHQSILDKLENEERLNWKADMTAIVFNDAHSSKLPHFSSRTSVIVHDGMLIKTKDVPTYRLSQTQSRDDWVGPTVINNKVRKKDNESENNEKREMKKKKAKGKDKQGETEKRSSF
jgi:hypothetical protein